MRVLGIETSCDETGIGLVDSKQGIVGQALFSQTEIHAPYGGVVPELASRDHIQRLLPLIKKTLGEHGTAQLDAVAYTSGPGLIGALMTGAVLGHSLAWSLKLPALGIHHMEAHMLALLLDEPAPTPPFVALLVSGGHTLLVLVKALGDYEILGETLDDAVGEAFDKTSKLLGLSYPGGPEIEKLARGGNPARFDFPRPMTQKSGLDFSFSGLKTHVRNILHDNLQGALTDEQTKADVARAFEEAVVDTLTIKCQRALKQTHCNQLAIAGGVSANRRLRNRLGKLEKGNNTQLFCPRPQLCTDNGVMIAHAGLLRLEAGQTGDTWPQLRPKWSLQEIRPPRERHDNQSTI